MNDATARALIALNNRFYAEHASSFSATRSAPWQGWHRLLKTLQDVGWCAGETRTVLDLACGNLRFEAFLARELAGIELTCFCVDACDELAQGTHDGTPSAPAAPSAADAPTGIAERTAVEPATTSTAPAAPTISPAATEPKASLPQPAPAAPRITSDEPAPVGARGAAATHGTAAAQTAPTELEAMDESRAIPAPETPSTCGALPAIAYRHLDILDALLESGTLPLSNVPRCGLVVCFGFLHHVPGMRLRRAVLDALIDRTAPGGIIALSCWQFMDDERLARKAARADAMAREHAPHPVIDLSVLDREDHFLGWQHDPSPLRYCHHVSEAEVDELAAHSVPRARELARFSADGATGTLNRYLLLQRRA